jgi:hypothetical protein
MLLLDESLVDPDEGYGRTKVLMENRLIVRAGLSVVAMQVSALVKEGSTSCNCEAVR